MTEPRALALIGELKANDDYFLKHYAPAPKTDITDADGVVYRYFAGRCFEFHPLANFGALNARVAAGDIEGSQRLADALIARGVYQSTGGIGWEYTFPYGGGRAPWLSGMAQAVAAQALARAAGTRACRVVVADGQGARRVSGDSGTLAHVGRRRAVDPPLLLHVAARAERTIAGGDLAAVLCDGG